MDFRDEQQEAGRVLDVGMILRIFLRRKWLFLVPFFVSLGVTAVALRTLTPIYQSAGQVQVLRESSTARSLPDEPARYRRSRNIDGETRATLETLLTSPKFLVRVVRELNLHRSPDVAGPGAPIRFSDPEAENRAIEKMANRLGNWIRVSRDGPSLFLIGVRHPDPQVAYTLARTIISSGLEEERASRLRPTTTTRDFLEKQRLVYLRRLQTAEQALSDFQGSMLSESLAGNPITETNLSAAESLLFRMRQQHQGADVAELANLKHEAELVLPGNTPPLETFTDDAGITRLLTDLTALEYDDMLADVDGRPRSADASNLLGGARLDLDGRVEAIISERYSGMGAPDLLRISRYCYGMIYREVNAAVIDSLSRDIAERKTFMTRQPAQSAQLTRLRQDAEQAQELLQEIERDISLESLRLAASMSEIGYRIEVRRDPRIPAVPIEPNMQRMAMLGFAMALAIGVGLVLLAELLDKSYKTVAQIEGELGLKVIGALPVVSRGFDVPIYRRRRWLIWTVLVVLLVAIAAVLMLYVYPRMA